MIKIYDKYVNGDFDSRTKHNYYQLAQYLTTISETTFADEFNVTSDEDVEQLLELVDEHNVYNINKLKLKLIIARHVECSEICLKFHNKFKPQEILDQLVI